MNIHQKIKAVGAYRYLPISNPESLIDLHLDKPEPTGRDLLVNVKAISVTPADVGVRENHNYEAESPKILGWDAAGIVVQVGPDCQLFKPGDKIYYAGSMSRPGSNSEFHLVDERIVENTPKFGFRSRSRITAYLDNCMGGPIDRLGISINANENKSILIIGAAGGVGSIAIQLAKLAGLTVIGTASRPESTRWVKCLGADFIINHNNPFQPQLKEFGIDTVDYIFCLNETVQHLSNMADAITPQGKICCIVLGVLISQKKG